MLQKSAVVWRIIVIPIGFCLGSGTPALGQQFRGFWADIFHNGYRSAGEVTTMVNQAAQGKYNAILCEVVGYMDRPAGSSSHGAFYKSNILPWASSVNASFDPLADLCTKAHAQGIEVHAWIFPFRVSNTWPPPNNAVLAGHPEWLMVPRAGSSMNSPAPLNASGIYWLDFGASDVQEYMMSIVRELVTNYPIDGIHWDYEIGGEEYNAGMGYPCYNTTDYAGSTLARYERITGTSGTPLNGDSNWSNFRRRVLHEFMARAQAEIQWIKTNPRQPLRHTASTMAYGGAPSCGSFTGEEAYTYFHDWPFQLQNGWLDAAIPMNYKSGGLTGDFQNWCNRSCLAFSRHYFVGTGAYLNTQSQSNAQLDYALDASGVDGVVTYSYAVPSTDGSQSGWYSYISGPGRAFAASATLPSMPWRNPATASEGMLWGRVTENGDAVEEATVTVAGRQPVKTDGNGYYVVTLIPATQQGTSYSVTTLKTGVGSSTTNVQVLAGDIVRQNFSLNIQPPMIVLDPVNLTRTIQPGQSLASESFTVANDDSTERLPLNYNIADDTAWLSVTPSSGSSDGIANTHTIVYDTASLGSGHHVGTVTVSDVSAANNPQQLVIDLFVKHPADADFDGDVDLSDFGLIQACLSPMSIPADAACLPRDCEGDGDVDQGDVAVWINCSNGPGAPPIPGCL